MFFTIGLFEQPALLSRKSRKDNSMRHRSVARTIPLEGEFPIVYETVWTHPIEGRENFSLVLTGSSGGSYAAESSEMWDDVDSAFVVSNGQKRLRSKGRILSTPSMVSTVDGYRLRSVRDTSLSQVVKPVNKCIHISTKIKPSSAIDLQTSALVDEGNEIHERYNTTTYSFPNGAYASRIFGGDTLQNDFINAKYYVDSPFMEHDWFALADSFNEACDQFIPSSTMLGEALVENAIFVDAFKAIVNPTSIVPTFFKIVNRYIRHPKKKNIGQISKELTKQAANDHLALVFGVLPAISTIKDTFLAHRKVGSRLDHLYRNAGKFVPVRVRRTLSSDVQNQEIADLPQPFTNFYTHCVSKETTAVMGSWGRVREEFNFGDTWSAYLQYFGMNKVLGLAWELVPFSFVVDWFTNAQEQINHLSRLNVGGPFTEFRGFSCSKKETIHDRLYLSGGNLISTGEAITAPGTPVLLADRFVTRYERYPKVPDTSGFLDSRSLGLFQYASAASVLIQRWLR
jgi:hypothetical protein